MIDVFKVLVLKAYQMPILNKPDRLVRAITIQDNGHNICMNMLNGFIIGSSAKVSQWASQNMFNLLLICLILPNQKIEVEQNIQFKNGLINV